MRNAKLVINGKNVQWFCHGIAFYSSITRAQTSGTGVVCLKRRAKGEEQRARSEEGIAKSGQLTTDY
jgi:hypothetical protein